MRRRRSQARKYPTEPGTSKYRNQFPVTDLRRVRVKWSQACKTAIWQQFNEDANSVLDTTAKGDADRRLQTMPTIIVSLAVERFGAVEKRTE